MEYASNDLKYIFLREVQTWNLEQTCNAHNF